MISILIPTYNYNIVSLVKNVHKQLEKAGVPFEILALDDMSNREFQEKNIQINTLKNTSYTIADSNGGIAITRQLLCERAKFEWIILLDADVELINENFISNYLKLINTDYDFIFGGFAYKDTKPSKSYVLRWKYGKQCEALSAEKRNKKPYKVTIAANLLARKLTYLKFNLNSMGKQYAMDYYFGALLKESNSKVLHLDNQVYHLGIEKSSNYLRKKEKAAETLINLYRANKINEHDNGLFSLYLKLKKNKLNYMFAKGYSVLKPILKKNLLSKNPSVKLLQLYKILYICYFDLKTK